MGFIHQSQEKHLEELLGNYWWNSQMHCLRTAEGGFCRHAKEKVLEEFLKISLRGIYAVISEQTFGGMLTRISENLLNKLPEGILRGICMEISRGTPTGISGWIRARICTETLKLLELHFLKAYFEVFLEKPIEGFHKKLLGFFLYNPEKFLEVFRWKFHKDFLKQSLKSLRIFWRNHSINFWSNDWRNSRRYLWRKSEKNLLYSGISEEISEGSAWQTQRNTEKLILEKFVEQ